MEFSSPLALIVAAVVALFFLGWFFLHRMRSVLREKHDDPSLLFLQQQIEQFRMQFSQALDSNAQANQQQLGQMLGHVNERLRDNADALSRTQQSLGERMDNASRVVSQVQRSLGGLEEANRKIYEVGKDIASAR